MAPSCAVVTGSGPSNGWGTDGCICIMGAGEGAWGTIAAGSAAAADGGTVVGAVGPSSYMSNSMSPPPDGGGGGGGALVCCKGPSGVASAPSSKSKRSIMSVGDAGVGSMILSAAGAVGSGVGATGTGFTAVAGFDVALADVVLTPPKSAAAIFCFSVMAGGSGAALAA